MLHTPGRLLVAVHVEQRPCEVREVVHTRQGREPEVQDPHPLLVPLFVAWFEALGAVVQPVPHEDDDPRCHPAVQDMQAVVPHVQVAVRQLQPHEPCQVWVQAQVLDMLLGLPNARHPLRLLQQLARRCKVARWAVLVRVEHAAPVMATSTERVLGGEEAAAQG